MDHEWQPQLVRHRDLGGEGRALSIPRRVVVVVVEAALADGNRPYRAVEQIGDRVDAVPRFVRVQPHGGVDVGEALGQVQCLHGGGPITTNRDQRTDTGLGCVSDDLSRFVCANVAMGVDPRTHALIRGNSGAPLTTGKPPG